MNVLAWGLGIVLAAAFVVAGGAKLVDKEPNRRRLGYTRRDYALIGGCEVAGAVALIVGVASTRLEWIGLAGAVGLCTVLFGALLAHARVGDDGKRVLPAIVLLLVAVAYLVVVSVR